MVQYCKVRKSRQYYQSTEKTVGEEPHAYPLPQYVKGFTIMESTNTAAQADRILDLGEKGCSRLLDDIADNIQEMSPGQTLLVIANDPAAPLDIKVWSRTSGNPLLQADLSSNYFLIQKKASL